MAYFLDQYRLLFQKGKVDYNAAGLLWGKFSSGEVELDLEIVMFHLQQCVEKMFKSILACYGINYPKTHDLETLIDLLKSSIPEVELSALKLNEKHLAILSDYAVEARYSIVPDDLQITEQLFIEVKDIIKVTDRLINS